ncbi:hypothetical protein DFP72DRAFT_839540 [Ephemerocybe angulata]|uniref:Uncharacterized protein n=1 Tax=Ephemerocybe angulata TaxID=980116 RepID=A0A8H6IJW9_9AGAR|nr:hypothetical protein DFP72DRAFT_839540 [Tulosesus angulatus]
MSFLYDALEETRGMMLIWSRLPRILNRQELEARDIEYFLEQREMLDGLSTRELIEELSVRLDRRGLPLDKMCDRCKKTFSPDDVDWYPLDASDNATINHGRKKCSRGDRLNIKFLPRSTIKARKRRPTEPSGLPPDESGSPDYSKILTTQSLEYSGSNLSKYCMSGFCTAILHELSKSHETMSQFGLLPPPPLSLLHIKGTTTEKSWLGTQEPLEPGTLPFVPLGLARYYTSPALVTVLSSSLLLSALAYLVPLFCDESQRCPEVGECVTLDMPRGWRVRHSGYAQRLTSSSLWTSMSDVTIRFPKPENDNEPRCLKTPEGAPMQPWELLDGAEQAAPAEERSDVGGTHASSSQLHPVPPSSL